MICLHTISRSYCVAPKWTSSSIKTTHIQWNDSSKNAISELIERHFFNYNQTAFVRFNLESFFSSLRIDSNRFIFIVSFMSLSQFNWLRICCMTGFGLLFFPARLFVATDSSFRALACNLIFWCGLDSQTKCETIFLLSIDKTWVTNNDGCDLIFRRNSN